MSQFPLLTGVFTHLFFGTISSNLYCTINKNMSAQENPKIAIEDTINTAPEKTWELYNTPEHVQQWNNASPDWHTPRAENNLTKGGKFCYRMEARDGSFGFDFSGMYQKIVPEKFLEYSMDDGRLVEVTFGSKGEKADIRIIFEAESINSLELQRDGWQAILNNFKRYAEQVNK